MHYIYPSDFLFWGRANNHSKIKEQLYSKIKNKLSDTESKQTQFWLCDVNTEFFDPANEVVNKYLDLITTSIYPLLDQMFSEIPNIQKPTSSVVSKIWYNHYEKAQYQEVHSHSVNSTLSGIYLLHLEEPNKTVFYSYGSSVNLLSTPTKQLTEAVEGDIIIFPSNLLHYVLPCEKNRVSIAFNITCEFSTKPLTD